MKNQYLYILTNPEQTKNNFLKLNRYLLIPIANKLSGKILELTLKSRTNTNAQLLLLVSIYY